MDPKDQFKERYSDYLVEKGKQLGSVPLKTRPFHINKFYVFGIIIGLLIVIPTAAYFISNNQTVKKSQPAQTASVTIAPAPKITVTEAEIDQEMQKIWGPYYNENKNDPKLRKVAKANIIKAKLVNMGLSQNNINLSSIASDNPTEQEQKAEEALMQKVLNWRNVDYAFIFIDPSGATYQTNVDQITYSYNLLKTQLSQGKTMQQAFDAAQNDPKFFKGITITSGKLLYQNSMDKSISDEIFKYSKGQTTNVIDSGGGTFILAQVKDSNNTPYATMDQWLSTQNK